VGYTRQSVMYLYDTGGTEAATDSRRYNEGSHHCACHNTAREKYYHARREHCKSTLHAQGHLLVPWRCGT
jgi:hypothetical protein